MASMNVPVLVHGMTTTLVPAWHTSDYLRLMEAIFHLRPELEGRMHPHVGVEWGQRLGSEGGDEPADRRLSVAELFLRKSVAYSRLRSQASDEQDFFYPDEREFSQLWRPITDAIKDNIFCLGMTDALYYAAPDGEQAIRRAVYTQVLDGLETFKFADEVHLHIVAQSLGATVAFDFLFGLFVDRGHYASHGGVPDFIRENEGSQEPSVRRAVENYRFWRERAMERTLRLGSLATTGSQLALFLLRKQAVVDRLAASPPNLLDPNVIGIEKDRPDGRIRWTNFFDADDVLGYPVRRLFDSRCIAEHRVDTGTLPDRAHSGYWHNERVIEEIALLWASNAV